MLVGFALTSPKLRMPVMALGFAGIAVWMYLTLYGGGGFNLQNEGYVEALVTALDQEASGESEGESGFVIGGIVGVLKKSLEDSGVKVELPTEKAEREAASRSSKKEHLVEQIRSNYERDREAGRVDEPWDGSGFQVMSWHYAKSLGRYFNNPAEIKPMVKTLRLAVHVAFWGLLGAMVLLVFGARRNSGILYWLLVLVPLALPLFFVLDYAAWLWWYGHTLNDMGAFSVKPFMPTVFGQGKVAQFSTHSYPYTGFGLMMLTSLVLAIAALIRRKQFGGEA
jgi:hypothetical protein